MVLAGLNDAQRRALNMMGKTRVPVVCQVVGVLFHTVLCYFLVSVQRMGIQGVGVATSVSNLFILGLMLVYTNALPELSAAR